MSYIQIKNISKYYNGYKVLNNVTLFVEEGEFMTLLGPSGSGKTTTLRLIAGLEKPEEGVIIFNGKEVDNGFTQYHLDSSKRKLSMVFQSYALWPHMTVFENVAFGLEMKKLSKTELKKQVSEALKIIKVSELSDRYPSELSGGQQQRVAIARAIVTKPKLLLMDEPLSNLDAKLRDEMRTELKKLHRELNTTIVYVTHDQKEAMTLSTRVAIFSGGTIVQVDKPENLYKKPADLRLAQFLGGSALNIIDAVYEEKDTYGVIKSEIVNIKILNTGIFNLYLKNSRNIHIIIAVKPETIKIHKTQVENSKAAMICSETFEGYEKLIQLKAGMQLLNVITLEDEKYETAERVWITYNIDNINIYDRNTGKLIELAEGDKIEN